MSYGGAGGAKQPFSFHCIICYEFLHPVNRPPVVLPCGHTHICNMCANRLDRCMECREPLSTIVPTADAPPPVKAPEPITGWRDIQKRRQQQNRNQFHNNSNPTTKPQPPKPPTKIPLPKPKNLVLLSLIESMMYSFANDLDQDGYESGDDDEYVRASMKIMGSTSGTYVVRAEAGLTVYDKPTDDNNVMRRLIAPKEIKHLVKGQTVQILSYDDGLATVARGAGYIHVKSGMDLVKGMY